MNTRFTYVDSLKKYDDCCQPYSISVEKNHHYDHMNGSVTENGYAISYLGAKHYLNVPQVRDFTLTYKFRHHKNFMSNRQIVGGIFFGYDMDKRVGYELYIIRNIDDTTTISLLKADNGTATEIGSKKLDFCQEANIDYHVAVQVNDGLVSCTFQGEAVTFEAEPKCGKIGLCRKEGSREIIYSDLEFSTCDIPDPISEQQLPKLVIPVDNGADEPYTLELTVKRYEGGVSRIDYTLAGGLQDRAFSDTAETQDSWATIFDEITAPYFKLNNGKRFYIENGTIRILDERYTEKSDANPTWETIGKIYSMYKIVSDVRDLPLQGSFLVKDLPEIEEISVGYDHFETFSYEYYSGAREFVYNTDGELIYNGESTDNEFAIDVSSPMNAELEAEIPKNAVDRELILNHLEKNHYFYEHQKPQFHIDIRTKLDTELTAVELWLQDAFLQDIQKLEAVNVPELKQKKYTTVPHKSYCCEIPTLECGVYHLSIRILYCGVEKREYHSAFEVLNKDSDQSPQLASGLPAIHVGDGGLVGMKMSIMDPWSQLADNSYEHYINITQVKPYYSERRRYWEVMHLFKRKYLVWCTSRTARKEDILSGSVFELETIRNADYINAPRHKLEDGPIRYRYDYFYHEPI